MNLCRSGVITGAAIGVLCVYATARIGSNRLTRTILGFERDFPPAFYAAMFLVTFEIGSLFDDVRQFMHGLVALRASGMHSLNLMGVLVMGVGTLTAISLAVGFIVRSRIGRARRLFFVGSCLNVVIRLDPEHR